MAEDLKKAIIVALELIKQNKPLIHHITNYVVMNLTANATLHIGASPLMAHAVEEVKEMAAMSKALVVNVGTLSERWITAMFLAGETAKEKKIPIVLDPVGMGATALRTRTVVELVEKLHPQIIKGNSSEIGGLYGDQSVEVRGVDTARGVADPVTAVINLAKKYNGATVIALSGQTDYVSNGKCVVSIENGSSRLSLLTGMGCTVATFMACFAAVTNNYLVAAVGGFVFMGVCAEIADKKTQGQGPSTFQTALFDQFAMLTSVEFEQHMKISVTVVTE